MQAAAEDGSSRGTEEHAEVQAEWRRDEIERERRLHGGEAHAEAHAEGAEGGRSAAVVWTQWCGRSGVDAVVWTQWCGRSGVDAVVWTQWCGRSGVDAVVWMQRCQRGDAERLHLWRRAAS
jgi:hypothetical protein